MHRPTAHRLAVAWGILSSLILITAIAATTSAAGLKRAARSDPKPQTAVQVAKAETALPTSSIPSAGSASRAAIAGPKALAPLGSRYDKLAQPGVTVVGPLAKRILIAPGVVAAPTSEGLNAKHPAPSPARVGVVVVQASSTGKDVGVTVTPVPSGAPSPKAQPRALITPTDAATPTAITPAPTPAPEPPAALAPVEPPPTAGAEPSEKDVSVAAVKGAAMTLTPEQAARLALKNSIDLQITAANIREADAQLRKTFGLDDVRLTASATVGRRGPIASASFPGADGEPTTFTLGSPDIRVAQLDLVKPIYTHGKIERVQDVALRNLETRRLSKAVVQRALDLGAREVSYNVLRAGQLADVAQQRTTAVAAHLDLTKKLQAGGVVPQFEVVQAETELARAQGDVISARTAVNTAKAALRRILTLPQEQPLAVIPGIEYEAPPGELTDLIAEGQMQRPEIMVGRSAVGLGEANVRLASASRNISVNLVAGLTRTQASFGSEPMGWQIAIAATKPILDGKDEKNEVRAARAQLDAIKLELDKTKEEIGLEVARYYLALDDARERLRVARQGVVEGNERLRIAQVRYENGIALGIEVLDAQLSLAAARAEVVNSQYNLQVAIAQLRSAVGLWSGNEGGEGQ